MSRLPLVNQIELNQLHSECCCHSVSCLHSLGESCIVLRKTNQVRSAKITSLVILKL